MLVFFIILGIFAAVVLLIYTPAIIQYILWKKCEKEFKDQLRELDTDGGLYDQCRMLEMLPLGIGFEPISSVSFTNVHTQTNQEFSVNTVLKLI